MKTRTYLLSLCAGGLSVLLLPARPAHAEWVLDHYERTGNSTQKTVLLEFGYSETPGYSTVIKTTSSDTSWTPQGQKTETKINDVSQPDNTQNSSYAGGSASVDWGNGRGMSLGDSPSVLSGVQTATATAKLTVRAVFKWNRRQISTYTPEQGYTSTPDPADNPPQKFWMLERAVISGNESTSQWDGNSLPYFYTHPYKDSEYSFSNISHPFKVTYPGTTEADAGASFGAVFNMDDSQVVCVPASSDGMAYGPERVFSGQVDLNHITMEQLDRWSAGTVSFSYTAEPVRFAVLSRLKGDHKADDLVTDFPLPNNTNYTQSTIAAGHKITPEHLHEADLALSVEHSIGWGYWGGVGNVKMEGVPDMKVDGKPGVQTGGALLVPSDAFDGTTHDGRIPVGRLLSRDKVTDPQDSVSVVPKNSVGTASLIDHAWANVEWKLSNIPAPNATPEPPEPNDPDGSKTTADDVWNELAPWGEDFYVGEQGYTRMAYARLKSIDGKPLTNHNFKFLVDYLEVQETDDDGEMITKIFTTDPSKSGDHPGDPLYEFHCQNDLSSLVEKYIAVPSEANSDDNGIVKGQFTVKFGEKFDVGSFRLALEDQGVYENKN